MQWCGKAGERDADYEIRSAGSKDLGLFLKRDNSHTKAAIMMLHGTNSSFASKIDLNALTLGDGESGKGEAGLFLNSSRVNHDCIGNCYHFYDEADNLEHLVANHNMPAGTEVAFSYVGHTSMEERRAKLAFRPFYGTCRDIKVSNKLAKMGELVDCIREMGSDPRQHVHALKRGDAL